MTEDREKAKALGEARLARPGEIGGVGLTGLII